MKHRDYRNSPLKGCSARPWNAKGPPAAPDPARGMHISHFAATIAIKCKIGDRAATNT